MFNYDHLSYEYSRPKGDLGEPSLTEMVDMAVRILEKNPKGYFLLVEGNCSLTANAWKMSSNVSIYLLIITFLILFAVWLNHYLLFVLVLFANSAFFSFIFFIFFSS